MSSVGWVSMINLCTKFEISNSTHHEDNEKGIQAVEMVWFGVVMGHSSSLEIAPFGRSPRIPIYSLYSNNILILHRF